MAFDASQWMYNSGSYQINNSVRFNGSNQYIKNTPSNASNRKTFTFSAWVKRANLSTQQTLMSVNSADSNSGILHIYLGSNDKITISFHAFTLTTTPVLRDSSAWYHIVFVADTTQAAEGNRFKIYVNGVQQTLGSSGTFIAQNTDLAFNQSTEHNIARRDGGADRYFAGYLSELHFIDGTAYQADSFGEYNKYGGWQPSKPQVTYGTNGFSMLFNSSGNLGLTGIGSPDDVGSNYAPQNMAATNQVVDTPTNNFATLNPLGWQWSKESAKMSQGNLSFGKDGDDWAHANGTQIIPKTQKIYFEVRGIDTLAYVGIALANENSGAYDEGSRPDGGWMKGLFSLYIDGNTQAIAYRATTGGTALGAQTFSGSNFNNAVVGVAVDIANSNIKFFINNTEILSQSPGNVIDTNKDYVPIVAASNGRRMAVNFGQDSSFAGAVTAQGNQDANNVGDFFYAPPSGYLALCTKNLLEPAFIPSQHFNAILYSSGSANGTFQITGNGFQPDMSFVKCRDAGEKTLIFDSVRGNTNMTDKFLSSANDLAEGAQGVGGTNVTVNADGMQIVESSIGSGELYFNSRSYVMWNWKANGAGASNTDGSINTTKTSANVDAGFSINTWVGTGATATIGHGLSKAPELILVKNRDDDDNWCVLAMVGGADATDFLRLDSDQAIVDDADRWNDTAPTSSVFTVDTDNQVNGDDDKMLAYCFHSVDGYSKVGSYIGNGSAGSANQFDGTFVHTGFKPKFLLFKRLDTGARWYIWDDAREPHNPMDSWLNLQGTNVETTALTSGYEQQLDFVSNGFKLKGPNGGINSIGRTFIFLAFAETPFKYSNAR